MKTNISPIELNQVDAYKAAMSELNKLYETEKGKHFVHHLIYSFNASPVYFVALNRHSILKDCLTTSAIKPVFTNVSEMPDDIHDLLDEVRNQVEVNQDLINKFNDAVSSYVKTNSLTRIAMTCKGTDKYIGIDEYQALCDFITEQSKSNESIRSMMNILHPTKKKFNKKKPINKSTKSGKKETPKSDKNMDSLLNQLVNKYSNGSK